MTDENNPAETPVNVELLASRLAREIARDLIPVDQICERYKVDDDTYQRILRHPMFQQRLQEELDIWNASTPRAITERISAKAATMIEESMVEVYQLIHDKAQPMSAKIDALKWASRLAGVGEREAKDLLPGERVRFNIYIGDKKISFEPEPTQPATIEGTAVLVDKDPSV
jgi:ribosomal protein L7/L12